MKWFELKGLDEETMNKALKLGGIGLMLIAGGFFIILVAVIIAVVL